MLTKGIVKGIISNLVIVDADGPVAQMRSLTSIWMGPD